MAGQDWDNFGPNDKATSVPAWEDFGPDQPATAKNAWDDFAPEPVTPAATVAAPEQPRSWGQRFRDNFAEAASRSMIGNAVRWGMKQTHAFEPDWLANLPEEQRNKIYDDALISATKDYEDAFMKADKNDPTWAEGKSVYDNLIAGNWAPMLAGQMLGGADPTYLIAPGSSAATRIAGQAAVNAGADVFTQGLRINEGVQDQYSPEQTALNAGAGALFQGAIGEPLHLLAKRGKVDAEGSVVPEVRPGDEPGIVGTVTDETPSTAAKSLTDLIREGHNKVDAEPEPLGFQTFVTDAKHMEGEGKVVSVADPSTGQTLGEGYVYNDGKIVMTNPETGHDYVPTEARRQEILEQAGLAKPLTEAQKRNTAIVDETNQQIRDLTGDWKNAPEFNVVARFSDLPSSLRKTMRKEGAQHAMGLVGDDGVVHIIANNVKKNGELPAVIFHETLGHIGLKNVFRDDLDNLLVDIYNGNNKIKKLADEYEANNPVYQNRPDYLARNVEEVFAELSEKGRMPPSLKNKLIYNFRQWARKYDIPFAQNYTWSEIQHIMSMAHESVIKGEKTSTDFGGIRYMMTGRRGDSDMSRSGLASDDHYKFLDAAEEGQPTHWGSDIHKETGWFVGPDGQPRKEISDDTSGFVPGFNMNHLNSMNDLKLQDIYDHPELFNMYPELKDIDVKKVGKIDSYQGVLGSLSYDGKTLKLNTEMSLDRARETILHEIQHAVQDMEGFARGGNSTSAVKVMPEGKVYQVADRVRKYYGKIAEVYKQRADVLRNIDNLPIVKQFQEADVKYDEVMDAITRDTDPSPEGLARRAPLHELFKEIGAERNAIEKSIKKALGLKDNVYEGSVDDVVFWHAIRSKLGEARATPVVEVDINAVAKGLDESAKDAADTAKYLSDIVDSPKSEASTALLRNELQADKYLPSQAYAHLFGEVEARDTGHRKNLTAEERAAKEPYKQEDNVINPDDFIFDMENGSTRYSLPKQGNKANNLNLDRINTSDEVETLLKDVASKFKERPEQSHDETYGLAVEMGMNTKKLLKLSEGVAPEHLLAARMLLERNAARLVEKSKKIVAGTATDKQKIDFARSMALHAAVQEKVARMTSNAGRVLNSFKIDVEGVAAVRDALKAEGATDLTNPDVLYALAKNITENAENPGAISKLTRSILKPLPEDYVTSFRYAMMLSGPGTHMANFLGNFTMATADMIEHGFAAALGQARRFGSNKGDRVLMREIAMRNYGMIRALLEGQTYKDIAKSWKEGRPAHQISKIEVGDAVLPSLLEGPKKALAASDSFWRSIIENGDMHGRAVRQAYGEGLRGTEMWKRVDELVTDPTLNMIEANDKHTALLQFVDEPSQLGKWLEAGKARSADMNAGKRTVRFVLQNAVPFSRVADRLFWASIRRSPLSLLDSVTRAELRKGGAAADVAIARTVLGSSMFGYFMYLASQDQLTGDGPKDYALREQMKASGWQPNSIKLGDEYVSLKGYDAIANNANMAANLYRKWKEKDLDNESFARQVLQTVGEIGRNMSNNTFTEQLGNLFQLADTSTQGESRAASFMAGIGSSFVPALSRQINQRFVDTAQRDTSSDKSMEGMLVDRAKAGTFGLSSTLPQKYDVFGRPMTYEGKSAYGVNDRKKADNDPVVQEVNRLSKITGKAVVGPVKRSTKNGITDSRQVQAYQKLSGEYIYQDLANEIKSDSWASTPDADKLEIIKEIVNDQRENAREDLGFVVEDSE